METTADLPSSDPGNPNIPPTAAPAMMPLYRPPLTESDVRMWSTLCHLAALLGLLLPTFGTVLGPLIVWLLKRNDHPTIDASGKESLNFQLSILIYTWALLLVGFATLFILVGFAFLGLAALVGLLGLIFAIVASIKVSHGKSYSYPMTIRFLS